MVYEPKNQADANADYQARDEWKIKSAVLAAMNDVARQTAEAEGKSSPKIEKSADDAQRRSDRKQQASELLGWLHSESVTPKRSTECGTAVLPVRIATPDHQSPTRGAHGYRGGYARTIPRLWSGS